VKNNHESSVFKELLDKLQQESWQLELLISGFAIFGLFSSTPHIDDYLLAANFDNRVTEVLLWFAIKICCWILIFNLLIHVILRGLWIGALGLRYVSGDIDYKKLNYSPKFTKFLQKKIGSFDKYIATLENYCSILFAISFLLIFYFLACITFIVSILLIIFLIIDPEKNDGSFENVKSVIGIVLILFVIFGAFLTFFDFISQGFLKKKKWLSKIYFPIYRVFSVITLSFLYRPLVYNFLDNKFGRRLSLILVPVFASILFLSSYHYRNSNYLSVDRSSSLNYANPNNYEDLLINNKNFIKVAAIPSKIITTPYLKVFMLFKKNVEDRLFRFNEGLRPLNDLRGLESELNITTNTPKRINYKRRDSLLKVYFKTFNEVHNVYIDDNLYLSDFIGTTNPNKKFGFETYLNIKDLKEGKHLLKITRKQKRKKDTVKYALVKIPFWHYKNN
jgi:hypothetical protein